MIQSDHSRDHLLSARVALFEADLALTLGDQRRAIVQLDLAIVHATEVRKGLSSIHSPAPRAQLPMQQ